ncbi:unnamed protein product [Gongylonema pulchrum]|uniref:Adaptin_N domain-containing protein n=1 Tax=Gongylonema pulchrum TaxID=637853 RepID=A0A183DEG4_9BILA|nr:unnamed protein product [Gongylonema pulchrum]
MDIDGGIFMPQLTKLLVASENVDYKAKQAYALCEKLLMPRKIAANLATKFTDALAAGPGPRADALLQKVCF